MKQQLFVLLFGLGILSPVVAQNNDWENQHVLQINREPAHASYVPFGKEKNEDAFTGWFMEVQLGINT